MITEKILLKYPAFVKLLTGLPAENFWELLQKNWAILATRFRCAHTIDTAVMPVVLG